MPGAPDLVAVLRAMRAAGAEHIVIGGFAVNVLGYIRATEDSDLLIPDDPANDQRLLSALTAIDAVRRDGAALTETALAGRDQLRVDTRHGLVDLVRGGEPPLDFASVYADRLTRELDGVTIDVAGLTSMVAFKRLAGRPRDRNDLEELEARYGPLPITPLPGLEPSG